MRSFLIKILILCVCGIVFNSCEAPHLNPSDPDNPDSKVVYISGVVEVLSLGRQNLSYYQGIKVSLEKEGVFGYTDKNGFYLIKSYQQKDDKIIFENPEIISDTMPMVWTNSRQYIKNKTVVFKAMMDSVVYNNLSVKWDISNQISQGMLIKIGAGTDFSIIDSINLINNQMGINYSFYNKYDNYKNRSFDSIPPHRLNLNDFSSIIGKKISLFVYLQKGYMFKWKEIEFKRIMKEMPSVISPRNGMLLYQDTVTFFWEPYKYVDNCDYRVHLYRSDRSGPDSLIASSTIIKNKTACYFINLKEVTKKRDLAWVLECIDEFGNSCKTYPNGFTYMLGTE